MCFSPFSVREVFRWTYSIVLRERIFKNSCTVKYFKSENFFSSKASKCANNWFGHYQTNLKISVNNILRLINHTCDLHVMPKHKERSPKNEPKTNEKNHISLITMGRQSKATTSRVNNLGKQKTRQKVTVEDVTDSEDEDYTPAVVNTKSR